MYNSGTAEGQEEKDTRRMMPLGERAGIKHVCPARALITTSEGTLEGSLCITTGLSKRKSLQQVGKGWEELSRFWENNYISFPFFTCGISCVACPLPPNVAPLPL